jgi:hypothetical protein
MIKRLIEYVFGVCFHDYEEITERPPMVDNPGGHCQYMVQQRCSKCGNTKEFWSDVYGGMKVVEQRFVPVYRNTIYNSAV